MKGNRGIEMCRIATEFSGDSGNNWVYLPPT